MKYKLASLAIAAVLALGIVIYGLWHAAPLALGGIVRLVPVSVEDQMGLAVARSFGPVCSGENVDALTKAITARLAPTLDNTPYKFDIRISPRKDVNALAAPGGHIVVFRGLIDAVDNTDQLAAVLAHEMQHVVQRHSTRGIIRTIGLQALLTIMLGDVGALGGLAGNLTVLHFARSDEQSADDAAVKMLMRADIDPSAMERAFANLERVSPSGDTPAAFKYLSTHPPLSERIARVKELSKDFRGPARPIEAPLKNLCPVD